MFKRKKQTLMLPVENSSKLLKCVLNPTNVRLPEMWNHSVMDTNWTQANSFKRRHQLRSTSKWKNFCTFSSQIDHLLNELKLKVNFCESRPSKQQLTGIQKVTPLRRSVLFISWIRDCFTFCVLRRPAEKQHNSLLWTHLKSRQVKCKLKDALWDHFKSF